MDNVIVNIPTSSGAVIATDDVGSVQHQLVKIEYGGDGVATMVEDVNPLPVKDAAAEASLSSIDTKFTNPLPVSGTVAVSNFPATQPISAASLPLPSGAAIAANQQTDALTNTQLRATPVPISGTVVVDTSLLATAAKQDTQITAEQAILAKLIAAPATEGKQDTGNTSLASIKTNTDKIPSQGQALMAASTPVVIASNQSAVPISGTVTVDTSLLATAAKQDSQITQETAINTVLGLVADATVAAGATGSVSAKLRRATQGLEDLKSLIVLSAGANIIGKVGIDQTTPGTTNGVQVNAALPAGTNLLGIVQAKDLPDAASTYALSNATSTAYEASHVIKNGPGYLYMVTGYNSNASTQFIMISNTTAVPADATTPVLIFIVTGVSNFSLDLGKYGRYFSTGICIFNSSTSPTKTLGAADCFFDCQYI